jgi:lysophospholipase L1-like esterase
MAGWTKQPTSSTGTTTPKYTGKKWVVVGDSLTEANTRATKRYHDYVAEELGFTVVNMGKSGTGYKAGYAQTPDASISNRILSVPTDASVVTIFGSGNDLNYTLGVSTDTDITMDTLCAYINTTLDRYYSILPTVPIGIITPCPWETYPNTTAGNKMELYAKAIVDIGKRRSIPVLDLYNESNLRPWDANFKTLMYSRDSGGGTHPDENGHKVLAPKFREFIQKLI